MKPTIGNIHQVRGDQFYFTEIVFYNNIEGEKPISIPFMFVDSLIINESLHNWITSGQIALNIYFEGFNRGTLQSSKTSSGIIPQIKAPYIDRTDGKNKISIKIYPVVNKEGQEDETAYPKDKWEISHDFIVTDIQDLDTSNSQVKKRIYKFVDERYQILKERNLEFSTAQVASKLLKKTAYNLKDSEKELNPNQLLKEILSLAASNQMKLSEPLAGDYDFSRVELFQLGSGGQGDKIKVGYTQQGSIDKPNINLDEIDNNNWDNGDPKNKIAYHSPAFSTAFDDLQYILSFCTAKTGEPVILDYGRYSDDKKWKLISLSELFKNAEDEQVEVLFVEDGDAFDGNDQPPKVTRASFSDSSYVKNFMSPIASRIQSYKFSPMVSVDDNRIINTALHFYDWSKGEFSILMKENSAKSVVDKLKELANKGLYSFKRGISPQILLNLNKTKTKGLMFKNELSIAGSSVPKNICQNQMIMDAIFLNQSISFQAIGLTLRSPGRFIHIDRLKTGDSNPYDDRFHGQWLITKVSHLFTSDSYITEVIAVKIDSFGKVWPEEDTNFS
jgi:hypothetical protein